MNAPCKNCSDRHMTCHDGCGRYQAYKDHRQVISEARKQANLINEYFKGAVARSMKMRRVHG